MRQDKGRLENPIQDDVASTRDNDIYLYFILIF